MERMTAFLEAEDGVDEEGVGDEPVADSEDTETEADESDEEGDKPEEEAEALEEITHNGETKQLTKAELKELAQQGFDYTQKTQQLAEQRRYVEEQYNAIQVQAQIQAQFTDQIAEVKGIEAQLAQFKQVNWSELAQTDPMQYLSLHHQYTEAKEAYQDKINGLNQLQTQAQQAQQHHAAQRLALEAQAMKQAIPEWKDAKRATAEMGELRQWLAQNGLSEAEIASLADHRQVTIARKAMLYDKMLKSGQKKVTAAPPTTKPGAKQTNTTTANDAKIRQALKKTGKGDYAAKLIERLL
jgi:hypothetical protein